MSSDIRQVYLLDFGNKTGYVGSAINAFKRCYQHISGRSGVEQVIEAIACMFPNLPRLKILDEFDNEHLINLDGVKSINVKLEQVYMWDFIRRGWSLLNKNLGSWPLFVTDEIRTAMSEAKKGHIVSEETKRKISKTLMGNTIRLGCKHTEETKRTMSEAHKGRKLSEETKRKLSEAGKGRKHTEEAKRKISESMKGNQHGRGNIGKKHSIETRAKISKALMGNQSGGMGGSISCCNRWHSNRPRISNSKLCQECFDKQTTEAKQ